MKNEKWSCWAYDVWGNRKDGFDVNDRSEIGVFDISEKILDNKKQLKRWIRKTFGLKRIRLSLDTSNENSIYIEAATDGYPIGEMIREGDEIR